MQELGFGEYCVELQSLQLDALYSKLQAALSHSSEMRKHVAAQVRKRGRSLEHGFDQLADLIPRRGDARH